MDHLVRIGCLGQVGRFRLESAVLPRGARVVCRTARGLQVGTVLQSTAPAGESTDGDLLRQVTIEDDLVLARLEQQRDAALERCQEILAAHSSTTMILDAEPLLDGSALCFYFLGELTPNDEAALGELAETYDAEVQLSSFAQTVEAGCGPDCGTDDGGNCGTGQGGCSSCSVATLCKK